MRGWLLALAALAIATGAVAAPAPQPPAAAAPLPSPYLSAVDPRSPTPTGFEHLVHDRHLVTSGAASVACATCHPIAATTGRLVGRPGHAACFGACHGAPPRTARDAGDRLSVCVTCHAPASLTARGAARPSPPFPPYRVDPDWGIALSHRAHAAAPCERCHATPSATPSRPPPRAPHARCAPCHKAGGTAPTFDACTACHVAAYGPERGPTLDTSPFAVGAVFSHPRHAARKVPCTACHAGVAAADGSSLPAPTMASCGAAACHDGKPTFAITEACNRCHRQPPTGTFRPARPTARFSHADHEPHVADAPCASCHDLDRRGEPVTRGHRACASCHADDFASAAPRTCGACHLSTEAWRPLRADQLPAAETEMGARISHRSHTGDCAGCHRLTTARRELRPPRGHASCTGAGCHARAGGPAPALADCAGCHQPGLLADRTRARTEARWSVRATFRHAPHRTTATGEAVPCTSCHLAMVSAPDVAAIPSPPKATCAPCHDGRAAFKLTGHGCARCHGGAAAAAAAP
jgi:c(7)-type cytochrome triheme protein